MGRRSRMEPLVEGIEASEEARERTKVILLTLSGDWSVQMACERLGVGRTRLQDLRRRMLVSGALALEARPAGRPRHKETLDFGEIQALRRQVDRLTHDLTRLQAELAIATSGAGPAAQARVARKGAL